MKPMIFIGDIGGEFRTLEKLVANCPKDRDILLLGDLNDRGPESREVIEWAMSEPRVDSLYSNHGDIMIDWFLKTKIYRGRVWITHNGGDNTLKSYGADHVTRKLFGGGLYSPYEEYETNENLMEDDAHRALIPPEHIEWLRTRPLFIEGDGWIATHAPINPTIPWEKFIDIHRLPVQDPQFENTVIWNRGGTRRREDGKYQIHGHTHGLNLYKDKRGEYGCGIDTSGGRNRCLTAFLWPEKTFVQLEFI